MSTVTGNSAESLARARLNLETAQISWRELQPYFARGATLMVSQDLDLVEVAAQISADNSARVSAWMEAGKIARVSDAQALTWFGADAGVWAVVVSPYVLVQGINQPA